MASDDSYECKFEKKDVSQSWTGTADVYLFIVTPHGAAVDVGDSATLSCVMTGKKIVDIFLMKCKVGSSSTWLPIRSSANVKNTGVDLQR